MKKIYFLILAIFAVSMTVNAQIIDDNFDNYTLGNMADQNLAVWSVWSGNVGNTTEGIGVSDAFAASGTQSGFIGAGPGPQDAMLVLGNIETGIFELSFNMYIPAGKTAYFNFQGTTSASGGAGNSGMGLFNSSNLVFNNTQSANGIAGLGGSYGTITNDDPAFSWVYPEDTWFPIHFLFEPDSSRYTLSINNVALAPQEFSADGAIGAIDFFAIDANNEYYIDDILFEEVILNSVTNPVLKSAKVYPNPVTDFLKIETSEPVDEITIYNVLGSPVLNRIPNDATSLVDMSNLATGLYFVAIRIGTEINTIKVTK